MELELRDVIWFVILLSSHIVSYWKLRSEVQTLKHTKADKDMVNNYLSEMKQALAQKADKDELNKALVRITEAINTLKIELIEDIKEPLVRVQTELQNLKEKRKTDK